MTTFVQARDAIVTHINTALSASYPTLKVFYENAVAVDLDSVGDSFVRIEIDFTDSVQSDIDLDRFDLSIAPGDQTFGEVAFRLFVKEGAGVRSSLLMFDFIKDLMRFRILGGVRTGVPAPGKKTVRSGWAEHDIIVPFTFYSKF